MLRLPDSALSSQRTLQYLDEKFSSFAPLREDVLQKALLESSQILGDNEKTLCTVKRATEQIISDIHSQALEGLNSARELALIRYSLSDELLSLREELVSISRSNGDGPTVLEEIEILHRTLKELENVKTYVLVIKEALRLSELAISNAKACRGIISVNETFISDCQNLYAFVSNVGQACGEVEDSDSSRTIKLVAFLNSLRDRTWDSIREIFSSSLLAISEKIRWPLAISHETINPEDRKEFGIAFVNLLTLQTIRIDIIKGPLSDVSNTDGLYPLYTLTQPISLRFKYHFEGSRETNQPDKPEWFFTHILNMSHEHREFMDSFIQPLIERSRYKNVNAWREFTRLLLPILARKISHLIPDLLPYPALLAHTVNQSLLFDDALRNAGFSLLGTWGSNNGVSDTDDWEGTNKMILGVKDWFNTWLEGEKTFALGQYNQIISSTDAWQIVNDEESEGSADTNLKPTTSAQRCRALIEQITDRYRPLPLFSQKTQFLISVQVPVLELYHTRISESLDAFETLSSFLARAVPGALAGQALHGQNTKKITSGVDGTQRLVKAFLSTKYMISTMESWGEDSFFLDLWETIREKSASRSGLDKHPSLPPESQEGTIFQELITQYERLASRAENMIIRQICGEVEAELRAHLDRDASNFDSQTEPILSPTLVKPIACLTSHLGFLRTVLPIAPLTAIYRQIASNVSEFILQRGIFSFNIGRMPLSERQLILDECALWIESCKLALAGSVRRVEAPWQRLLSASKILNFAADELREYLRSISSATDDSEGESLGIIELDGTEVRKLTIIRDDYRLFESI